MFNFSYFTLLLNIERTKRLHLLEHGGDETGNDALKQEQTTDAVSDIVVN